MKNVFEFGNFREDDETKFQQFVRSTKPKLQHFRQLKHATNLSHPKISILRHSSLPIIRTRSKISITCPRIPRIFSFRNKARYRLLWIRRVRINLIVNYYRNDRILNMRYTWLTFTITISLKNNTNRNLTTKYNSYNFNRITLYTNMIVIDKQLRFYLNKMHYSESNRYTIVK